MTRNIALALGMLIFCGYMYWETFSFPEASRFRAGPEVFPRFLLAITAALSAILLVKSLITEWGALGDFSFDARSFLHRYWLIIALFGLFGFYVFGLSAVGFIPATLAFLMIGQVMIARDFDVRSLALAALISVIATFSIYYVFSQALRIWLP